jgi:SAM-dependent methyltransferase
MITIDYCVCCNGKNVELHPVQMYQFVINRMTSIENSSSATEVGYLHCFDCDYAGTTTRFSREEEFRYYKNYMKDEYINHRCAIEGEENRNSFAYYSSEPYKEIRRKSAASVLSTVLNFTDIYSVLDYGGDTGEMIPKELDHASKYVTDVEVRNIGNGVKAVSSPNESGLVDLVICGHTLEHVSYPMDLIVDMKRYIKPNGWLYIEVPKEVVSDHQSVQVVHEHINHYNHNNLKYLLTANGFKNVRGAEVQCGGYAGAALVVTGQLA